MRVLFFAGAALVSGAAIFGAVRAGQEATPIVASEAKRVIRQVTQTELVEQLKAELTATRSECAKSADALAAAKERIAYLEELSTQRSTDLDMAMATAHDRGVEAERLKGELASVKDKLRVVATAMAADLKQVAAE
jgi:flagellar motility protein MotE (MotC chaperone)